jgi:hypothetical protein
MQQSIAMKMQRRKIFLPQQSLLRYGPAGTPGHLTQFRVMDPLWV